MGFKKRGLLYVIEGPDWSGKDDQLVLLGKRLKNEGYSVIITREPGSELNGICGKIRQLLLDKKNFGGMSFMTELFLYLADRSQHHERVVIPALERGDIILTSRSRYSTDVYQGIVRELGLGMTRHLNKLATYDIDPDLAVFIEADVEKIFAKRGQGDVDRIEKEGVGFQRQVMDGYLRIAKESPGKIQVTPYIDTSPKIEEGIEQMHNNIYAIFKSHIGEYGKNLYRKC